MLGSQMRDASPVSNGIHSRIIPPLELLVALGQSVPEKKMIFFEEYPRNMKDRIGNKESRQYIDRVMKVPQQDNSTKKNRSGGKQYPKRNTLPKYQCHEKCQPGVTREKEIPTESKP